MTSLLVSDVTVGYGRDEPVLRGVGSARLTGWRVPAGVRRRYAPEP